MQQQLLVVLLLQLLRVHYNRPDAVENEEELYKDASKWQNSSHQHPRHRANVHGLVRDLTRDLIGAHWVLNGLHNTSPAHITATRHLTGAHLWRPISMIRQHHIPSLRYHQEILASCTNTLKQQHATNCYRHNLAVLSLQHQPYKHSSSSDALANAVCYTYPLTYILKVL